MAWKKRSWKKPSTPQPIVVRVVVQKSSGSGYSKSRRKKRSR